jgi:hypothetical protein
MFYSNIKRDNNERPPRGGLSVFAQKSRSETANVRHWHKADMASALHMSAFDPIQTLLNQKPLTVGSHSATIEFDIRGLRQCKM